MEKGGKLFSGSPLGKRGPAAAKGKFADDGYGSRGKYSDDGYGSRGRPFGSDGKGDYLGGSGPARSSYGSYKGEDRASSYGSRPKGGDSGSSYGSYKGEDRAPSYGSGYGSRPKGSGGGSSGSYKGEDRAPSYGSRDGGESYSSYRSGGGGKDSGKTYGGAIASGKPSFGYDSGAETYGSSSPAYSSRASPASVFGRDGGKSSYGAEGGGKASYGKASYGRSMPYGAADDPYGGGSYKGDGKRGHERPAARYGAEPDPYSSRGGKAYEYDSYSSFKGGDKGGGAMRAPMKGERGKGKAQTKIAAGETVLWGVIKSYNPEKKSGFIDCPMLQQTVYVYQDVLQQTAPTPAGPGDRVAFFVHWSAKGQPQASRPLIKLKEGAGSQDGSYALRGTFRMPKGGKDFGFIDCDEIKEFFGRDVFVKQELASGLQDADMVSFNCFLNREGLPAAEEAAPCDEGWEPRAADLSFAQEVETGKGQKGAGKDKGKPPFGGKNSGPPASYSSHGEAGSFDGEGKGEGKGGQPEPTGRFCSGQIKSFNQAKNYGFVECEEMMQEYGCDVFMHGKEFVERNLQVGDYVSFEVGMNSRGQPQALDICKEGTVVTQEPPAKRPKVEVQLEDDKKPLEPGPLPGTIPPPQGDQSQPEEPPATADAAPAESAEGSFSELVAQEG
eukprot:TRINITY_DN2317_c0_g1_i1.p1 TRINITY_DN2317_c0_g1~~TRINITY_DN2317_c0_g1_i1.p1  ORF type:complete len:668 (-),score=144.59 TRINITY_DN2317_c0_g1_i1:8-2011(-)